MSTLKKLAAIVAALVLFGLTGCDSNTNTVTLDRAKSLEQSAANKAREEEAKKADAKLAAAKMELGQLGRQTARQGGFSANANCNVTPNEVMTSEAIKAFPSAAVGMYRDACTREVAVMNSERKANRERAIAAEQLRKQKLAAARDKQERIAKAVKDCDSKPAGKTREACVNQAKRLT